MDNSLSSLKLYIEDIRRFPLIDKREEQLLGKNIKNAQDLDITYNGEIKKELDLDKLFILLCNNNDYETIISRLIASYSQKESERDILDKLIKYQNISKDLERSLSKEELFNYFNIIYEKIDIKESLLMQIDKYLIYRYSFDKMFYSNLRLVIRIARINQNNFSLLDLIQEGNIGLMKAIDKFDYEKGAAFATYASHWILQAIKRYEVNKHLLSMSEAKALELINFNHALQELKQRYPEGLTEQKISEELHKPVERIRSLSLLLKNETPISLDEPLNNYNNNKTNNISYNIADDFNLEDYYISTHINEEIQKLFKVLNDKEKYVLTLRYDLNNTGVCLTLPQIAKKLQLCKQRVHAIEKTAIEKLRNKEEILSKRYR